MTLGNGLSENSCVQLNYNLPYTPKEFYKPLYWEGFNSYETRSMTTSVKTWLRNIFAKPKTNDKVISKRSINGERVRNDLSAGELYHGIEATFEE